MIKSLINQATCAKVPSVVFFFLFLGTIQYSYAGGAVCIYQDASGNVICTSYGNSGGTCGGGSLGSCNSAATSAGSSMDPSTCGSITSAACTQVPQTFICYDDPPPAPTTITMCFIVGNASCGDAALCTAAQGVLPVELMDFRVEFEIGEDEFVEGYNVVSWSTASEYNSSHFELQYLPDENSISPGFELNFTAAGNSSIRQDYGFKHANPDKKVNVYMLKQVDLDGNEKLYGPISIDNSKGQPLLIHTVNMMGQSVDEYYKGITIEIYDDGSTKKRYRH